MIVNPAMSVDEIERAIARHADVFFTAGRYCLPHPIRLQGLTGRRLRGEPGACLVGGERARAVDGLPRGRLACDAG